MVCSVVDAFFVLHNLWSKNRIISSKIAFFTIMIVVMMTKTLGGFCGKI